MKRSSDNTHHGRSPIPTVNGFHLTLPTQKKTSEQEYNDLAASNRRPSTPYARNNPPKLFTRNPVVCFLEFGKICGHLWNTAKISQIFWRVKILSAVPSGVTRGLSQREQNGLKGPSGHRREATQKKSLKINVNPDVKDVYATVARKTKTPRKSQKSNNLLKNKRWLNVKMSSKGGPVFTYSLSGGGSPPPFPPPSVTPLVVLRTGRKEHWVLSRFGSIMSRDLLSTHLAYTFPGKLKWRDFVYSHLSPFVCIGVIKPVY